MHIQLMPKNRISTWSNKRNVVHKRRKYIPVNHDMKNTNKYYVLHNIGFTLIK